MKQIDLPIRRIKNLCILGLLFSAVGTCGGLKAQQTALPQQKAQKETALLGTPQSQVAVSASDTALLAAALGSPEFAERLQTLSEPIYVMMHGIDFEPIAGLRSGGKALELLDKETLLAKNPDNYFIVKEFQRTERIAYVDLMLRCTSACNGKEAVSSEYMYARNGDGWEKQALISTVNR